MCTLKPPRMLTVWSRGVSGQGFVSSENARERPRGEQTKTWGGPGRKHGCRGGRCLSASAPGSCPSPEGRQSWDPGMRLVLEAHLGG